MKHDVVYILKNNYASEELRYSVRSVVQNFPHIRIIFVGGKPDYMTADIQIFDNQVGGTKWERSTHSLKLILENEDITEDFWLFNDDFFIMNKVEPTMNFFGGTLEKRISELRAAFGDTSAYCRGLERTRAELLNREKDALSFALHVPMLINRTKALRLFDEVPSPIMFRSYYGNYFEVPCQYMKDVKVRDLESVPGSDYLSTTDEAFKDGKVGEFIRASFPDPCDYEKDIPLKELYTEEGEERYDRS